MFKGDEPDDIGSYLTPSHFLLCRNLSASVIPSEESIDSTATSLNEVFAFQAQLMKKFWTLWSTDYIRGLPAVVKGFHSKCDLKKGNIVLIKEDNVSRIKWPLEIIVD